MFLVVIERSEASPVFALISLRSPRSLSCSSSFYATFDVAYQALAYEHKAYVRVASLEVR